MTGCSGVDLVCVGELLVDMFPAELGRSLAEVSSFEPKPGGAPANVAVAAARLGVQSAFIGKVGDDAFGLHLARVLEREGVCTRGILFDRVVRTTMAFIAMPDEDRAEFVFYRNPGADMLLRSDELNRGLLLRARALHLGSVSLTEEPSRSATFEAVRLARDAGALVSFDVNYRPTLWGDAAEAHRRVMSMVSYVDVLKVSEAELALLTESRDLQLAAAELLARGPRLCVVTLGRGGSYFRMASGGDHVPAFPVKTVDATGCGDGFMAGLLRQLLTGGSEGFCVERMRQAVRYANAVGALTSLTRGVIPALPTARQVDTFLAAHGG